MTRQAYVKRMKDTVNIYFFVAFFLILFSFYDTNLCIFFESLSLITAFSIMVYYAIKINQIDSYCEFDHLGGRVVAKKEHDNSDYEELFFIAPESDADIWDAKYFLIFPLALRSNSLLNIRGYKRMDRKQFDKWVRGAVLINRSVVFDKGKASVW